MERLEWLKWRQKGIGGSDAPLLMGVSPYGNILDLYKQKIADEIEDKSNFVMDRGNRYEPRILAWFNAMNDSAFSPELIESQDYPFLRCSLDGKDGESILEIKIIGKEFFLKKEMPAKYYPQVQHNLMISRARVCFFIMLWQEGWDETKPLDSKDICVIPVYPDLEYQKKLLAAEISFWHDNVEKRIPPITDTIDISDLVQPYVDMVEQIKILEGELEKIREKIIAAADATGLKKVTCGNLKITKEERKGAVDYSKVPELKDVDLEQYRKKSSTSWRITA